MNLPPSEEQLSTVYHVEEAQGGQTLGAVLKDVRSQASWGQVKKWIVGRHVQVNGNLCLDDARRVKQGDVVKFFREAQPKPVEAKDVRIVHLDDHLLIVNKPAYLTSVRHSAEKKISSKRRQLQPTLEELLPVVLAKIQRIQWPPRELRSRKKPIRQRAKRSVMPAEARPKMPAELRVIPVHRLDRDTSGLMVFARSPVAAERLQTLFRRHQIRREYVGFCHGQIESQTIESNLVRDRGDGRRGSFTEAMKAELAEDELPHFQPAMTHVVNAHSLSNGAFSQFRCRLETGRTHQIRIHLAEAGHMLCGEKIYTGPIGGAVQKELSGLRRHALHSDKISFKHPVTNEQLHFSIPLAADLAAWLANHPSADLQSK